MPLCEFPLCRINALRGKTFCAGHNRHFGTARPKKGRTPILKKAIDLKLKKN